MKAFLQLLNRITIAAILVGAFLLPTPAAAQSGHDLYQKALRLENSVGDLEGAIALYGQVVEKLDSDRALVAGALLRMGRAYEMLGRIEAFAVYERIVLDFDDLEDEVTEARSRMQALASSSEQGDQNIKRKGDITILPAENLFNPWGSAMSHTGRQMVGISRDTGYPGFLNVATGEWTEPNIVDPEKGISEFPRLSHKEDRVAFGFWPEGQQIADLRLLDVETSKVEIIFDMESFIETTKEVDVTRAWVHAMDWYADDDAILTFARVSGTWIETEEEYVEHFFLKVWADRNTAEVLLDGPAMLAFGGSLACLVENDTAIIGNWWPDSKREIGKFFPASGLVTSLRADPNGDYDLFSCPGSDDAFVYAGSFLSSKSLFKGSTRENGNSDLDKFLLPLQDGRWGVLGSENGDVVILERGNGGRKVTVLSKDENGIFTDSIILSSSSENQWFTHGSWHSVNPVLYSSEVQNGKIWLIRRDVAEDTMEKVEIDEYYRVPRRGFEDDQLILTRMYADGTASYYTYRGSDLSLVDSVYVSQLRPSPVLSHIKNRFLYKNRESDCIEWLDSDFEVESDWICFDKGSKPMALSLSPDRTKYQYSTMDSDSLLTLGILDLNGQIKKKLGVYDLKKNLLGFPRWGNNSEIYFAIYRRPKNAPVIIDQIRKIDIETGDMTSILPTLSDHLFIRTFSTSHDGQYLMLHTSPLQSRGNAGVVMHGLAAPGN